MQQSGDLQQCGSPGAGGLVSGESTGHDLHHLILLFQASNLKRMALQFVVRNMSTVVRSRDWKESLLDHPALMAEVRYLYISLMFIFDDQVMETMARKESGEGFSKRSVSSGGGGYEAYKRQKNDGPVRN